MKVFAREGQECCGNCGGQFVAYAISNYNVGADCPNKECNRGAEMRLEENKDFSVEINIDTKKLRRQVEDRLRKDDQFLKRVAILFHE